MKKLRVLEGTPYTATVVQQDDTDYLVKVTRPANEGEVKMFHAVMGHAPREDELVGSGYMKSHATIKDLNRVVEDIIVKDTPLLVGVYTGEEDTE